MPKEILEEQDDLASALRESFNEHSPQESADPEPTPESKPRDEAGRFAAKEGETEVEAAARLAPKTSTQPEVEAKEQAPVEGQWKEDKAPQSWTPASREKWASIDPEIRKEIVRREEASVMGVRQLQEQMAPARGFLQAMEPYAKQAQLAGMRPDEYIGGAMQSMQILSGSDIPTKFNELMRIADQFGVPLRDVINQSVGQEVLKRPQQQMQQMHPEIQKELAAMRQWREQQEYGQVTQTVNGFGADKEFFNDVRNTMADLVERGMAPDLQSAYDQACWMLPQVREVMLARQGKQAGASDLAAKQAAARVSKPAGGKVAVQVDDVTDEDDLPDIIRKQMAAQSGRV